MKKLCYLFYFWITCTSLLIGSPLKVISLTCEYSTNPLGIDVEIPLLGWKMESAGFAQTQKAYEIRVGTNPEDLRNGKSLVWNSGKVNNNQNIGVIYKGRKLKPFTRYYWQVRVYNQDNEVSDWSEPAWWETSLLQAADWKADWIGDGKPTPEKTEDFYKDDPAPLFRKDFSIKKEIRDARLYVAGLGYYEASLNGKKIDDRILDPGWTNYGKQILYSTYDITPQLQSGDNTIGIVLGNGFYNPLPMRIFQPLREYLYIGRPCVIAQIRLTYTDGTTETIVTDNSWKTAPGPILRNNVYIGEHYDARKEISGWDQTGFDDSSWNEAIALREKPAGKLTAQMQPPIRITETIKPVRMTETRPGEFVFDLGKNMGGVIGLRVKGPEGTHIKIRYGEDIYSDGSLNVMTSVAGQQKRVWDANWDTPGQPQTAWQEDSYILKGKGEEIWTPQFTFHGFRYVEITGWPGRPTLDDVVAYRMNSDLERTGQFECSNPLINQLMQVMDNTFLSNVFSVQSDCPAREKFGYGGDIVGVARTFCYFYDMENFYRKAIQDFANDQRPLGGMTETAPYNGIADRGLGDESGPIGWQLGFAFMQKQLYDYYGDIRTIQQFYPTFRKQVEFLRSQAKGHLIDKCINDHESLEERIPELFATAHYYHHILLIIEFASLIGNTKDVQMYTQLAKDIKQAFINAFVKEGTGKVGNQTQASQAMGIYYDLLPENDREKALDQLLDAIQQWNGHVAAGIFGVPAIFESLRKNNRNDIAYEMVTQKEFPGWGHMLVNGATTLWETWKYSDNVFSHNHPMFGSVGEWIFQGLAGINALESGFRKIEIKPFIGDMEWAKCSYNSVNGMIISNWEIKNNQFSQHVSIPPNTTAVIYLPATDETKIQLNKIKLNDFKNIQVQKSADGMMILEVGSGEYQFIVTK